MYVYIYIYIYVSLLQQRENCTHELATTSLALASLVLKSICAMGRLYRLECVAFLFAFESMGCKFSCNSVCCWSLNMFGFVKLAVEK